MRYGLLWILECHTTTRFWLIFSKFAQQTHRHTRPKYRFASEFAFIKSLQHKYLHWKVDTDVAVVIIELYLHFSSFRRRRRLKPNASQNTMLHFWDNIIIHSLLKGFSYANCLLKFITPTPCIMPNIRVIVFLAVSSVASW